MVFPFRTSRRKRAGQEVVEREKGDVRGWDMSKNVRRGSDMSLLKPGHMRQVEISRRKLNRPESESLPR